MSLLYGYNLNYNTKEVRGTSPSTYKEREEHFILQANDTVIENCKSYKLSYLLTAGQIINIILADLGIKFLKSIAVDTTQKIELTYGSQVIEGTILFIDNILPATLPTTLDPNTIIIRNTSVEAIELTLFMVATI